MAARIHASISKSFYGNDKSISWEHILLSLNNRLFMIPRKECLGCADPNGIQQVAEVSFLCSLEWIVPEALKSSISRKTENLSDFSLITSSIECESVSHVSSRPYFLKAAWSSWKKDKNSVIVPWNIPEQSSMNRFHNFTCTSKDIFKSLEFEKAPYRKT